MKASERRNTIAHVNLRWEPLNPSASQNTKWDCGSVWILCIWTSPGDVYGEDTLSSGNAWLMFFKNLGIRSAWFISLGSDKHPKASKVMPNLDEMRAWQNHLYKGGGMMIDQVPVGRDEWEYYNLRVAYRWPYIFSFPLNWVKLLSSDELDGSQYPTASFSTSKDYE